MLAEQTLVSVEEYLNTSYEGPDPEYIDGIVVERYLGEKAHSRPQRKLIEFFGGLEKNLGAYAFPSQRIQINTTRFRVPDLCVYIGSEPEEQVFRTAPFLAIEILSQVDSFSDLLEKLGDYRDFRIPFVWIIDPRTKRGYTYSLEDEFEAMRSGLRTRDPDLELPIGRLFEG